MKKSVVSAIQIGIEPHNIPANTEKCCEWICKARREHRPDLVVLPESVTTGFTAGMPLGDFYDLVEPVDGPSVERIRRLARQLKIWICFPMYEKSPRRNVVYNSALLVDRHGRVAGIYRKTHPFPTERLEGNGWTTPGTSLPVFKTDFGTVGITICYEGDFPELSRILALKGAEIILRPSAFLRSFEIWELTNKARAYDNHVYLVGVNAVGPDASGNSFAGHSMIVSPIARTLAQARGSDEIISSELDPDPIKYVTYGSKAPMIFDHLEDRNPLLYKDILRSAKSPFEPAKRIPYKKKGA
ncbi:MAG TPA: carbon-nitrogen hydrolase family protein [Elusimicrobiota bacterium]|nr:carbon-nitrogen hydrolase family protein [Elusimicrobiota bacterium]